MLESIQVSKNPQIRNNQQWLDELRSEGLDQAQAIEDLWNLLLRASLYTFYRYKNDLENQDPEEIKRSAEDCAQESLIAVLKHLDDFRGDSKFTTWAYKFAVNNSLMAIRKERYIAGPLDAETYTGYSRQDFDDTALQGEIGEILRRAIRNDLTEKQRLVLKLIVFDEVPMDVVVDRLNSNRNAVYKLLHDARYKLKQKLIENGFSLEETLGLFEDKGKISGRSASKDQV